MQEAYFGFIIKERTYTLLKEKVNKNNKQSNGKKVKMNSQNYENKY